MRNGSSARVGLAALTDFAVEAARADLSRLLLLAITLVACSTPQTSVTVAPPAPAGPYGLTAADEARIIGLEDRREYDPALVEAWIHHPNPTHRARIALALG